MIVVETILGNRDEPEWQARLAAARIDYLEMDQWEAQKSRFRKKTADGAEFAISLNRGLHARDGDILQWNAVEGTAVVARIDVRDVMVIHLEELMHLDPQVAMRTCIELGHAMGNQHWPALVKGSAVYVPLVLARKVMDSVMRTHSFEKIHYEFISGREVIPYLAPHETRRLFGAAEGAAHSHVQEKYAVNGVHAANLPEGLSSGEHQHMNTEPAAGAGAHRETSGR